MPVKVNGIVFNQDSIHAIQKDMKTETRRVINPQPKTYHDWSLLWTGKVKKEAHNKNPPVFWQHKHNNPEHFLDDVYSPYGGIGDCLWVREDFAIISPESVGEENWMRYRQTRSFVDCPESNYEDGFAAAIFKADGDYEHNPKYGRKWKSSRHIPRWAARYHLEVTNLQVEKIQDVDEEGAKREGMNAILFPDITYRKQFAFHWDLINAKRGFSWKANPIVWVISFKFWTKPLWGIL